MATTAETFGWDTVYAIKYADVNTAIANSWPSPAIHIHRESGPASIDGDFAPWKVDFGGSGHLVCLSTPVPALVYNGNIANPYNATAKIQVQLEFIPQPAAGLRASSGSSGGQWHDLRLQSGSGIAVSIIEVTYSGTQPAPLDHATIKDLFRQWFNDTANLQEFNTVFASVNLNARADVDAFQWLQPTSLGYAVAEEESLPDGVFAVLCMTEGRPATDLPHQVSPFAIPVDARSAFVISAERYLMKLLMPGLGVMFTQPPDAGPSKIWPDAYFHLLSDGMTLTNTGTLTIAQLQVADHQTQTATIAPSEFTVRVAGNLLAMDIAHMRHPYRAALAWMLNVDHEIHSTAKAALRPGQVFALDPYNGSQTIVVTKTAEADWLTFGLDSASLLLLVTGLGYGIYRVCTVSEAVTDANTMTRSVEMASMARMPPPVAAEASADGATAAVAAQRTGVVQPRGFLSASWEAYRASTLAKIGSVTAGLSLLMKILNFIATKDGQHQLPNFNEFAAGVMAPVQWPSAQSEFTVTDVAFNGSFQVSGDPGFAN